MQQAPAKDEAQLPIPNVEELSRNIAALVEEAGKATAAYLRPLPHGFRGSRQID